jgi:hypothetical protein
MWKKAIVAYFKALFRICVGVLTKLKKISKRYNQGSNLVLIRMQTTRTGEHLLTWGFQHWLLGSNDSLGGESEYVIIYATAGKPLRFSC